MINMNIHNVVILWNCFDDVTCPGMRSVRKSCPTVY